MIQFRHQRIKALREAHGMTLEEMANKMGKAKQQLGIWENGINNPTVDNLVLMCNTFDVQPAFFFDSISTPVEETAGTP